MRDGGGGKKKMGEKKKKKKKKESRKKRSKNKSSNVQKFKSSSRIFSFKILLVRLSRSSDAHVVCQLLPPLSAHRNLRLALSDTEIKNIDKEVAENQVALDSTTAIRQEELPDFNAEEKEQAAFLQ